MVYAKRVEIHVLVDDYSPRPRLLGQHGLSLYIVVEGDWGSARILFDTGQDYSVLEHNARILGIDPGNVDAIILSHGHYDHTGGLLGAVKHAAEKRGGRIPVVVHPDAFLPAIHIGGGRVRLDIGIPYTRGELVENGARLLEAKSPLPVAPATYYLGEVEKTWPELAPGLPGAYTILDGRLVEHPLRDDTGLAITVEGLGAIVIGGCSHSGIANIAKHAEKVTGEKPYAVIGGFHLAGQPREKIEETIRVLKDMGVERAYPGHCTGLRAEHMMLEAFGGESARIYSGARIVFEAGKA